MKETATIIIADDHPLMRKGLKDIIDNSNNWSVIGEAGDGESALELIEKLKPSAAIIDIDMPKLNGLEVVKIINQKKLPVRTIILTMYDKETIFNRAMDLGVMGYVLKDSAVTEIVEALKNIITGKFYISPAFSDFLLKRGHYSTEENTAEGISRLTSTERKILKMIAGNMTTKDIANELFVSIRTVETHRTNICNKLDLHGTNALLRFALSHQNLL
jgi:DNA-binding NarL/FixJ family response regulator